MQKSLANGKDSRPGNSHNLSTQFGIQILTIEVLLNKKEGPRYPNMARGRLNFKKAKKEKKDPPKLFDE
jgi:hypothetical protein